METQTQTPVTQVVAPAEVVAVETQPVTAQAAAGDVQPAAEVAASTTEVVAEKEEVEPVQLVSPAAGLVGTLVLALVALAVNRLRKK